LQNVAARDRDRTVPAEGYTVSKRSSRSRENDGKEDEGKVLHVGNITKKKTKKKDIEN
jgi:hypothetical protein